MINYFYLLILIQALAIIFMFNHSINPQMIQKILENYIPKDITIECGDAQMCQDVLNTFVKVTQEIQNKIIEGQNSPFYILIFPLMLTIKLLNKEIKFIRRQSFWFYWIQYPFLLYFIQKLSLLIKHYGPELIMTINIFFGLLILNLTFMIINQQFLSIKINNTRKPLYILFFLLVINLLYNMITFNNQNWIPYIIINAYIQMYLIHIDSNLFKDNKYNEQQKSLIQILYEKISFFNQDNHFIIKKEKVLFVFIILPFIIYFREILLEQQVLITLLLIIIQFTLCLKLDTSLVSTTIKLKLKDQWLAADLFFIDFLLPFRNIVMLLLLG